MALLHSFFHNIARNNPDLIRLKKVFNSIKDGMAKREEIFELPGMDGEDPEIKNPYEDKKSS